MGSVEPVTLPDPVPPSGRVDGAALATLADLADLVRRRLTEVGALRPTRHARHAAQAARGAAMVIVTAAAPFAPTPYARARLLRQMHGAGLLSQREVDGARRLLGVAR